MARGFGRCVVVLTRHRGYRKQGRNVKAPWFIYRRFPELRAALSRRSECYNRQLELVERLEDEGRILAIRPSGELEVDRLEDNTAKLTALYEEGYAQAEKALRGRTLDNLWQ